MVARTLTVALGLIAAFSAKAVADPVIMAAGDIACDPTDAGYNGGAGSADRCHQLATSDLLLSRPLDAVLPLGDIQYDSATTARINAVYAPTWGRVLSITRPILGNHESGTAAGYFDYFNGPGVADGPAGPRSKGYYSFDLGTWHLIALNSNCATVACIEGSAQNNFLEQDLATTQPCILAYWHHPLISSRTASGGALLPGPKAFWDDLYAAHADVVLNGHEHDYQRYARQDAAGHAASNGIREFIVGTGGKSHDSLSGPKDPDFEFGQGSQYGVLKLNLGDNSYSWEFVAVNGTVLDAGGPVPCN